MHIREGIVLGSDKPVLFSGPCAVESYDICIEIGTKVKAWAEEHGFSYVFKASFDKANRTSANSNRGDGMDAGLAILAHIAKTFDLPVTTDIHDAHQSEPVASVVDILQIPAFLCRQTDLVTAAVKSGRSVNIKKGQFLSPQAMVHIASKAIAAHQSQAPAYRFGSAHCRQLGPAAYPA